MTQVRELRPVVWTDIDWSLKDHGQWLVNDYRTVMETATNCTRPDMRERLRTADDRTLNSAVDEFMRFASPVPTIARTAKLMPRSAVAL